MSHVVCRKLTTVRMKHGRCSVFLTLAKSQKILQRSCVGFGTFAKKSITSGLCTVHLSGLYVGHV